MEQETLDISIFVNTEYWMPLFVKMIISDNDSLYQKRFWKKKLYQKRENNVLMF